MNYRQAVEAALRGDPEAFGALYEMTYTNMYYIALKYVKNQEDAEDVLQDAYMRAFRGLGTLKDPDSFPGWLGKIVANTSKNLLVRKKPLLFSEMEREDEDGDAWLYDMEDDNIDYQPELNYTRQETRELIRELIDSLSDEQRMCILMFYLDHQSVRDIAEAFSISENTVKSRLNYGRKALRKKAEELEKKGYKLYSAAVLPLLLSLLRRDRASAEFLAFAHRAMEAGAGVCQMGAGQGRQRPDSGAQGRRSAGDAGQHTAGQRTARQHTAGQHTAAKHTAAQHTVVKHTVKLTVQKFIIGLAVATVGIGGGFAAYRYYSDNVQEVQNLRQEGAEVPGGPEGQPETYFETAPSPDQPGETEGQPETHFETESSYAYPAGTDTEAGTETEAEPGAETETGTKTETEAKPETEAEPGAETETETKTETEAKPETEAETGTEAELGTETETEAKSETETELETETETETARELKEEEYPLRIAGNLTKQALEFVFAYGPQEIPENGFDSQTVEILLTQLYTGSRYQQQTGGNGWIEEYGPNERRKTMISASDVNRLFASFSDYAFTEENYGPPREYGVEVEGDVLLFYPATMSWSPSASILSAEYTGEEIRVRFIYEVRYDENYAPAAGTYLGDVTERKEKTAILLPNEQGMYRIVRIEENTSPDAAALSDDVETIVVPDTTVPDTTVPDTAGWDEDLVDIVAPKPREESASSDGTAAIREIYENVLNDVANGEEGYDFPEVSEDSSNCQYFVHDMDGDGISELIIGKNCFLDPAVSTMVCHVYSCEEAEGGYALKRITGTLYTPIIPAEGDGLFSVYFSRGQGLHSMYRVTIQNDALAQADTPEYELHLGEAALTEFLEKNPYAVWSEVADHSLLMTM